MAVTPCVQEFLRRSNVDYAVFRHPMAFTAQEEATHVPGADWAKVVVCVADGAPLHFAAVAHPAVGQFTIDLK